MGKVILEGEWLWDAGCLFPHRQIKLTDFFFFLQFLGWLG